MQRVTCGLWLAAALAACSDATRTSEPSAAPPAIPVAAATQQFVVRNLGTLGGSVSSAAGINEAGEVVGNSKVPSGRTRAFLWRPGQGMRGLGTLGGANSLARGINDRTEVVGLSEVEPGSEVSRAFFWSAGSGMRDLGTLGGENSAGNAVNNRGEVVGFAENRNGHARAFLWRPGRGMQGLGTLGGHESRARDVNDATQVVGFSQTENGDDHAFLWTAARGMEDLGTLGGPTSAAFGISETGEVVGTSSTAAGTEKAFIWTRGNGMRSLGNIAGDPALLANAVNTHRRAVGHGEDFHHPFLWTPAGGLSPLPTLGGTQGQPQDLNEFGQIAGTSVTAAGEARAALWIPTSGPLAMAPAEGDAEAESR